MHTDLKLNLGRDMSIIEHIRGTLIPISPLPIVYMIGIGNK